MTFGRKLINIVNNCAKDKIPKPKRHQRVNQNGQPGINNVLDFPLQCAIFLMSMWTCPPMLDTDRAR